MKIKYLFAGIVSVLLLISISQIFPIPPHEKDISRVYRSGYFSELDREFEIIRDSFIGIKTLGKPAYAWIFLKDLKKQHDISVDVFNSSGFHVPAPGERSENPDKRLEPVLDSMASGAYSEVRGSRYFSIVPVYSERKCQFCHKTSEVKNLIGFLSFERKYDAHIYYTSERIIIFILISVVFASILFILLKWDPERKIKEMFDKS